MPAKKPPSPETAKKPRKPRTVRKTSAKQKPKHEVAEEKQEVHEKPEEREKEGGISTEGVGKKEVAKQLQSLVPPSIARSAFNRNIFAVVRIRGVVGVTKDIADTLMMLRLDRINHCVIIPKNPNFEGMLQKARYFITWGEIDQETLEKLVAKRGRFVGDKRVTETNRVKDMANLILSGKKVSETGIKPVFRLSPPSKGYRSTKTLYPKGSLGYRGEKINELLKRMI